MRKLLLSIAFILISLALTGCSAPTPTPTPTPTPSATLSPLSVYFSEALPIIEQHRQTAEAVSEAIETINSEAEKPYPGDPSKTQMEAISPWLEHGEIHYYSIKDVSSPAIPEGLHDALTTGVNTLEWAMERIDSAIGDYERLNPPSEAWDYHNLFISYLKTERTAWDKLLFYNSSILNTGYADYEELRTANMLSLEARVIWLEARLELEELNPELMGE